MSELLSQIIEAGQAKGLNQKALAARAGVSEEALSRAKKRGNIRSNMLESLAKAAGLAINLAPAAPVPPFPIAKTFRERHRDLVWSNPNAPDEVLIRAALIKPKFMILLDAAIEYGVDRLKCEWGVLRSQAENETVRIAPITERILKNIEYGYQQASA